MGAGLSVPSLFVVKGRDMFLENSIYLDSADLKSGCYQDNRGAFYG